MYSLIAEGDTERTLINLCWVEPCCIKILHTTTPITVWHRIFMCWHNHDDHCISYSLPPRSPSCWLQDDVTFYVSVVAFAVLVFIFNIVVNDCIIFKFIHKLTTKTLAYWLTYHSNLHNKNCLLSFRRNIYRPFKYCTI